MKTTSEKPTPAKKTVKASTPSATEVTAKACPMCGKNPCECSTKGACKCCCSGHCGHHFWFGAIIRIGIVLILIFGALKIGFILGYQAAGGDTRALHEMRGNYWGK